MSKTQLASNKPLPFMDLIPQGSTYDEINEDYLKKVKRIANYNLGPGAGEQIFWFVTTVYLQKTDDGRRLYEKMIGKPGEGMTDSDLQPTIISALNIIYYLGDDDTKLNPKAKHFGQVAKKNKSSLVVQIDPTGTHADRLRRARNYVLKWAKWAYSRRLPESDNIADAYLMQSNVAYITKGEKTRTLSDGDVPSVMHLFMPNDVLYSRLWRDILADEDMLSKLEFDESNWTCKAGVKDYGYVGDTIKDILTRQKKK
jgi:hypothetical protein